MLPKNLFRKNDVTRVILLQSHPSLKKSNLKDPSHSPKINTRIGHPPQKIKKNKKKKKRKRKNNSNKLTNEHIILCAILLKSVRWHKIFLIIVALDTALYCSPCFSRLCLIGTKARVERVTHKRIVTTKKDVAN